MKIEISRNATVDGKRPFYLCLNPGCAADAYYLSKLNDEIDPPGKWTPDLPIYTRVTRVSGSTTGLGCLEVSADLPLISEIIQKVMSWATNSGESKDGHKLFVTHEEMAAYEADRENNT